MDKILNKWYFSLILIPFLINIFSSSFDLNTIFDNSHLTLTISFALVIFTLSYELFQTNKKYKLLKTLPKKSDKKKIRELLLILDVDRFENSICKQFSWYGYEKESFRNVSNFIDQSEQLKYKITNNNLNLLVEDFRNKLLDFRNTAGKTLYLELDFYEPDKKGGSNSESERQKCEIIDKKADEAFINLENLLSYLNKYNYI